MDVLIAIIATYISITYIFPVFDLLFQWFNYWVSDKANALQIASQIKVKEFEEQYPEEKSELSPAIGFHMNSSESEFDDEEEEDCKRKVNKIGFYK